MGKKSRAQRDRQAYDSLGIARPVPVPPPSYAELRAIDQERKKDMISKGRKFGQGTKAKTIKSRVRRG